VRAHGDGVAAADGSEAVFVGVEPGAVEVGNAQRLVPAVLAQRADDTGVADDQHLGAGVGASDVGTGRADSVEQRIGGFSIVGSGAGGEEPRPSSFDVLGRQALPGTEPSFHQPRIGDHRADAEELAEDDGGLGGALQGAAPHAVELPEQIGGGGGVTATVVGERRVLLTLPATLRVPLALAVAQDEDPSAAHRGEGIGTLPRMAVLRLFASAREAAGTGRDLVPGDTVADVLDAAVARYGEGFRAVLPTCAIWVNGDAVELTTPVADADEVAVLPPVSGGM
jgi:sulfur-carrier protein